MITGIVILLAADALLVVAARFLRRVPGFETPEDTPVTYALLGVFVVVFVHIMASVPLAVRCDWTTVQGRLYYFVPFILQGSVPFIYYASLFIETISDSAAEGLYGMGVSGRRAPYYADAEVLIKQNDVDGALAVYRTHFAEDPTNPEPLFEAVRVLVRKVRFHDAADGLRDIVHRFEGNTRTWARAVFYLAELHQAHLNDPDMAATLMRTLAERAPRSQYGGFARKRLAAIRMNSQRPIS